jgi:YfiH family protein
VTATEAMPVWRVAEWNDLAQVVAHGFFGRRGGIGTGACGSLNVSEHVGDDPSTVAENWRRIGRGFPATRWVRMRQVHGTRVVRGEGDAAGEADGLISTAEGTALAVLTADCVPMLAVAPAAHAVMALHAGWRGSLAGIAIAGLREARNWLGIEPHEWRVALGPSIGGCCYEVEAELGEQFVRRWGAMPDVWQRAGTHGQLDLRAVNRRLLIEQGVPAAHVVDVGPCTACRSDDFFSHRASGGRAGRQLSAIAWAPAA